MKAGYAALLGIVIGAAAVWMLPNRMPAPQVQDCQTSFKINGW